MELPKSYSFVYPPSIRFGHLFQRPQQLMLALARLGYDTYFVDPWGTTPPKIEYPESFRLVTSINDVPKENVVFWATQGISFPQFRHLFYRTISVFDFVDANEGYEEVLRHQISMGLENADLVFAVSRNCQRMAEDAGVTAFYLPNGADFEHFSRYAEPSPLARVLRRSKKPIVGFYGAVFPWVDTELIMEVARLRPQYQFLIIGPEYGDPLKGAPDNITKAGHVPYDQLPGMIATAAVFILPFRVDLMTNASDPIKLWEYLATGKPIVSTPIEAAKAHSAVIRIADTPAGFAEELDQAVAESEWHPNRWIRRHIARENSWDVRAQEIVRTLGDWLERRES